MNPRIVFFEFVNFEMKLKSSWLHPSFFFSCLYRARQNVIVCSSIIIQRNKASPLARTDRLAVRLLTSGTLRFVFVQIHQLKAVQLQHLASLFVSDNIRRSNVFSKIYYHNRQLFRFLASVNHWDVVSGMWRLLLQPGEVPLDCRKLTPPATDGWIWGHERSDSPQIDRRYKKLQFVYNLFINYIQIYWHI